MSVQIKCRIVRESEKAIFIRQEIGKGAYTALWIPRSQCDHLSKGPIQADGSRDATITMAEWLAEKHNLETQP